jgi:hypothetical protein
VPVTRALIAAVVLLALGSAGAAAAAPAKKPAKPFGVTWGTRHFTDGSELRSWLGKRGIRYEDWLARHPRGRFLMTHLPPPAVPSKTRPPVAATTGSGTGTGSRHAYELASLLLLVAVIPLRLLTRVVPARYLPWTRSIRLALVGGGLSIALGSALASFL